MALFELLNEAEMEQMDYAKSSHKFGFDEITGLLWELSLADSTDDAIRISDNELVERLGRFVLIIHSDGSIDHDEYDEPFEAQTVMSVLAVDVARIAIENFWRYGDDTESSLPMALQILGVLGEMHPWGFENLRVPCNRLASNSKEAVEAAFCWLRLEDDGPIDLDTFDDVLYHVVNDPVMAAYSIASLSEW